MLNVRRALFIALVGLILISLLEWGIINEISQYSTNQQTNRNQSAAFSGPVFLGLRDGVAWLWRRLRDNHDELLVIFTALLFGVTALLVRYTRGLMGYTRRLWASTSDLVTDAKDTAKKELRAYVAFETTILDCPVIVRISNYGKTPAHRIVLTYDRMQQAPKSKPVCRKGSPKIPLGMIAPTQFYDHDTGIDGSAADDRMFWLHGMIEYMDVFECEWIVHFCYRYEFTGGHFTHKTHSDYNYQERKTNGRPV